MLAHIWLGGWRLSCRGVQGHSLWTHTGQAESAALPTEVFAPSICWLTLALPVFAGSMPQDLILKAAACCHV